jgi:hypothetical protein
LRIVLIMGMLLAAAMAEAEAADCQNDIIQGLIRPQENTVPAYEIITRSHAYYKVLGPNAAKAGEWREADVIILCAGARQSGLYKITNKRLRKMLDAELTPPPMSPLIGTGLAR